MAYSLKHKLISWVSKTLFDNQTYTVRSGVNKGLRRRGGLGWVPIEHDTPESKFWKALILRDKIVYDVGAFHGLLTIYFAKHARRVVAWEPTSRNRNRLEENLRLNSFSNVVVRPYGLSSSRGVATVSFDPLIPGTASIAAGIASGAEHETIELRSLDEEEGLESPDFIKIDVEGFELEVLQGGKRLLEKQPDLFLEMHGADPEDKKKRVTAIVNYLWALGYRNILHVETGQAIEPGNAAEAAQGHLYVRRT